ncbi:hypothetical protein E2562_033202 [Oryza meyeriana var. granulata]|uniref:Uncharacterized protein n=1 Tax=Oryza meyeriana var. granulata TaxID=110450 RepID=A0A6G1DRG8_9ORYZ|nr:hypothetical protein E2562_033202 [Oryza meyeriana var. granulata]
MASGTSQSGGANVWRHSAQLGGGEDASSWAMRGGRRRLLLRIEACSLKAYMAARSGDSIQIHSYELRES